MVECKKCLRLQYCKKNKGKRKSDETQTRTYCAGYIEKLVFGDTTAKKEKFVSIK